MTVVAVTHLRTIAGDARRRKDRATKHRGELTLEEIAELLPGTGEIMASVGDVLVEVRVRRSRRELAARRVLRAPGARTAAQARRRAAEVLRRSRGVRGSSTSRPALAACDAKDQRAFDRAFAAATDKANELHVKWAKPYIRWTLPDEPPKDLEMSSQP